MITTQRRHAFAKVIRRHVDPARHLYGLQPSTATCLDVIQRAPKPDITLSIDARFYYLSKNQLTVDKTYTRSETPDTLLEVIWKAYLRDNRNEVHIPYKGYSAQAVYDISSEPSLNYEINYVLTS